MIYRVGGFSLHVDSEGEQNAHCLSRMWKAFFYGNFTAACKVQGDARLQFTLECPAIEYSDVSQKKNEFGVWQTADRYYRTCGSSRLVLDLENGEGTGYLAPDFWNQPLLQQLRFLLAAIIVLLRSCGGYGLHANSVAWDGNGALIVGHSGSGKTTLTLGLLKTAGARCLGDDALLLCIENNLIQAHALRRGFGCTHQTALQFPALADAFRTAPALSDQKKLLYLDALYPERFIMHCTPRIVLFPVIQDTPHSYLTALKPFQTLCALLEQSLGILLDAPHAQRQIQLLQQLVRQVQGYRIHMGRDVYTEPERVADLLHNAMHA